MFDRLDEHQSLNKLPRYVTDNSDHVPSLKLEDSDLRFILAKMDRMEAVIHGLQSAVNSVHHLVSAIKPIDIHSHVVNHGLGSSRDATDHSRLDKQQPAQLPKAHAYTGLRPSSCGTLTDVNKTINTTSADQLKLQWSANAALTSAGDSSARESTYDDGDGYEIVGSRRKKRRLRIAQSSKENSPPVSSAAVYSAVVKSNTAVSMQSSVASGAKRNVSKRTRNSNSINSKKPLLVGKGTSASTNGSTITAARQFKAVYCVDNVDQSIDETALTEFVSSLGVRVLSCFKVKPRLIKYQREHSFSHCTFRLCINRSDSKLLLQADKWPTDLVISKWFFSTKSNHLTDNDEYQAPHNATEVAGGINMATPGPSSHSGLSGTSATSLAVTVDVHEQTEIDMDATIMVTDPKYKSPVSSSGGQIISPS